MNRFYGDRQWVHASSPDKAATKPVNSEENYLFHSKCSRNLGAPNKGKVNKKFICRYFSSGYCRFGDACWFVHQEMEKPLMKAKSYPEKFRYKYSSAKSKCAEYSPKKSYCG